MTEVEICGGGHCTRLRSNCVSMGCAPPPYMKGWRRGPTGLLGRSPKGGILLLPGVGTPPFLVLIGGGRKGERGGRKGGPAPLLIRIGLGWGLLLAFSSLFH